MNPDLLAALGHLEKETGDRADQALVALERRDAAELARVLGTSLEEAQQTIQLFEEPNPESLDRDVERWSHRAPRSRRPGRLLFHAVSLAGAFAGGATFFWWASSPPALAPAAAVLDVDTVRSPGTHDVRAGDSVTIRVKPEGGRADLEGLLLMLEHGGSLRALEPLSLTEADGIFEVVVQLPSGLQQESCDWKLWLAHARDPRGGWRLVPLSPTLRFSCPSGR